MAPSPLEIIAASQSTEDQLRSAIQNLGPPKEPPEFWSHIASDESYTRLHRRYSIFQLFRRHILPGMTLAELAGVVGKHAWLSVSDVAILEDLGGHIPVKLSSGRTVLVFDILPDRTTISDRWQVYIGVAGSVSLEDLRGLLFEATAPESVRNARILEIGFSPPLGQVNGSGTP